MIDKIADVGRGIGVGIGVIGIGGWLLGLIILAGEGRKCLSAYGVYELAAA